MSFSNGPSGSYDYYSCTNTTRQVEDARLAMQAVIGLEAEWPVLQQLGIQGCSIHCVGAGPCFYESELFKRLAPSSALATDVDGESIEGARARYSNSGASFQVLDATAAHPRGFDVAMERFLLIQMPETTARTVVSNMAESLPSGGRALLTEFVNSFCIATPSCDALLELRRVMMDRFKSQGADPDIGLRLERFLEEAGLQEVRGYDVAYVIQGAAFSRQISVGGLNFGTPAEIIGNSYAKRFEAEHPGLVREFREWLNAASSVDSNFRLEHKYRIAVGAKG